MEASEESTGAGATAAGAEVVAWLLSAGAAGDWTGAGEDDPLTAQMIAPKIRTMTTTSTAFDEFDTMIMFMNKRKTLSSAFYHRGQYFFQFGRYCRTIIEMRP